MTIERQLVEKAKYVIQVRASDYILLDNIFEKILIDRFGYKQPYSKYPESYGHAAARSGIYYIGRASCCSISANLSEKETVDDVVEEATKKYFDQRKEKPKVIIKVKAEIGIS